MVSHSNALNWKMHLLTIEAIDQLEKDWRDLSQSAIEKNIYFFPWFIRASLPLYQGRRSYIVEIREGALLVGLFLMQKDLGYAKAPIGFWRTAMHPHQLSGTPLVRTGYAQTFARGLCQWLDAGSIASTFALWPMITGEGEIMSALQEVSKEQARSIYEIDRYARAAATAHSSQGSSPDQWVSASRRKSIMRQRKKLSQLGDFTVRKLLSADELSVWLDDFIRLENMGWKGEKGTSIQKNPDDETFYREMTQAAFADDCLTMFRLEVDGTPIAYTMDIFMPSLCLLPPMCSRYGLSTVCTGCPARI